MAVQFPSDSKCERNSNPEAGPACVARVRRARLWRALPLCAALVALDGCKLVDQRTFDQSASRPPKPYIPPAPPAKSVPPLVSINAGTPASAWKDALARAVSQARARKPTVLFTVTAVAPAASTPEAQRKAMAALVAGDAREIATAIIDDGAQASQVEIAAITDSSVTKGVIRVYVH